MMLILLLDMSPEQPYITGVTHEGASDQAPSEGSFHPRRGVHQLQSRQLLRWVQLMHKASVR